MEFEKAKKQRLRAGASAAVSSPPMQQHWFEAEKWAAKSGDLNAEV